MITVLFGRLRAVHPNHKRIASGAVRIGLLVLAAKLFVAAREIAIAWRYGISEVVDAYQLSLTITTWLPMMLVGVMTVVLVPRFVQTQSTDRRMFIAELNGSVLLLGLALGVLTWLAAPAAADLLADDSDVVRLTKAMAAQMAPIALLIIPAGYLSARMQARERYGYTATEALQALVVSLFVLAPLGLGVTQLLVLGTLFGYFLQLLLLGAMTHQADPPLGNLEFQHRSAEWQSLYGSLLLMGVGQVLITAALPIDQSFATRLGEGAVATLGYANRIIILVTGLATVVIGRALLPIFSAAAASGAIEVGRRQALQWAVLLFAAGGLSASLLWWLAPDIVRFLFQRGAFGEQATADVATAVRYGLLQLPPYCGGIVLVQWYAATGRFRSMFTMNAAALLVKIALNAALAPSYGLAGIMISTAGMYVSTSAAMAVGLASWNRRRTGQGDVERNDPD